MIVSTRLLYGSPGKYVLTVMVDVRISYLRDSARPSLISESGAPAVPLNIVVPYTNPAPTARALKIALRFAQGIDSIVTLLAVHVVPYPAPLECDEGMRARLEAGVRAVVPPSSTVIRAKLVFARSREQVYAALFRERSLVVIGTRDCWWPTREERFARRLAKAGHSVAIVRVR